MRTYRTQHTSVFLVTVHDPVCSDEGNLEAALYGSFLPVPSNDIFPIINAVEYSQEKAPGAVVVKKGRISINQGRERVRLRVTNNGDRPIQVRNLSCRGWGADGTLSLDICLEDTLKHWK